MWKKLDKDIYSSLKRYEDESNATGFIVFAVLSFIGALLIFNRVKNRDIVGKLFIAAMVVLTVALLIAALVEKIKWNNYSKLLDGRHGEYCHATLLRKLHIEPNELNNCYYIIADINGKRRKIRCTQEVYTLINCGEQIIVVDLSGSKGKLTRFCIGLAKFPEPLKPGNPDFYHLHLKGLLKADSDSKKKEIIDNMLDEIQRYEPPAGQETKEAPLPYKKGYTSPELIPQDICRELIKQEKRNLIRVLLPMIIWPLLLLLIVISAPVLMSSDIDMILYQLVILLSILLNTVFIAATIMSFVAYSTMFGESVNHLRILRSGDAKGEKLTYMSSSYYGYTKRRDLRIYRQYYHLCRNYDGERIVIQSDYPTRCHSGETVVAVHYSNDDIKVYHYTLSNEFK